MRFQTLRVLQVKRYYGIQRAGAIDVSRAPEMAREARFVAEGLCGAGLLGIWFGGDEGGGPSHFLSGRDSDPF